MPLYDLDQGCRKVTKTAAENNEYLEQAKKRLDSRTFNKMVQTVDEELRKLKPSQSSQLTWAKCAALLGYSSSAPTRNTNHLWNNAFHAFRGHQKSTNIFVGSLVRWRISLLPEKWLCMRDERNELDPDTGKPIKVSAYWINEQFRA